MKIDPAGLGWMKMLVGRLLPSIEDRAERLPLSLMADFERSPGVPTCQLISHAEVRHRVCEREAPWRASLRVRGLRVGVAGSQATQEAPR
jgi:hypothetical protein